MWSQQIFVASLCICLASQQVAAVVNNGQSAKIEEQKTSISENADTDKSSSSKESDSVTANSEEKTNRREAPLMLGDNYGAPLAAPVNSYLPSGQSNINLPVPVYGVPEAPTNNIIYPAPPPDIPPPVSLPSPSLSYGLPLISNSYGPPPTTGYLPPVSNSYGPPPIKFDVPSLSPPKFSGPAHSIKPVYGPPRFQYGPPGKPLFTSKFSSKFPYKSNFGGHKYTKPLSTYGPPSGYFKDNYNPSKIKFNSANLLTDAKTFGHSSFSSHSSHSNFGGFGSQASLTQYGVPNVAYGAPNLAYGVPNIGTQTLSSNNLNLLNVGNHGISSQYGVPDVGIQIISSSSGHDGHSISTQHGALTTDIHSPVKSFYGPPQPSSHPKPPHPGAPAPPTPPDIKYDGWQPIPGLVSRAPPTSYGVPHSDNHNHGQLDYNKDLIPPPLENHNNHQAASYTQVGQSDSYGAPLNTVTGSGGVVASSGEEVHGHHVSSSGAADIDIGQNVDAVKSIGLQIYPSGTGSIGGHGHSSGGGYNLQIQDSYRVPPADSYSTGGPYAAAHSYNGIGSSSLGFDSLNFHSLHNSFNSHKSHGSKGLFTNIGKGLIPPNGLYGVPPSGQYGTALFTNTPHGPPLNALKINPPKHPVVHREPVPPGIFDSISKPTGHKNIHGHSSHSHHSFGSAYLPPPVPDIPKKEYVPSAPTSLYSLPNAHTAISFQNIAHGSSSTGLFNQNFNLNIDAPSTSALSSYNAPLNIVDGSYNLPQLQTHTHLDGEVVGLDLSHPALTIDLTQNHGKQNNFGAPHDCNLHKTQSLPSLSYGVPSANSYTNALSSLTTNIGGAQAHTGISLPQTSYQISEGHSAPAVNTGYEVSESHSAASHDTYDLSAAHSQKVTSESKANLIESESHGKNYGKSVAKSFGPSSELIQSQSIDLNNIALQGALGSYTLQIQSADGSQGQVPHGQVLNDGLLQSILAAIEQPQQNGGNLIGQPIIQFQKSLEQQNFVTNDTISSVVGQLADAEIQHSSPVRYVVEPSNEVQANVNDKDEEVQKANDEDNILLEDNGIALFYNNQRSKKETKEASLAENKPSEKPVQNSH